MGSKISLFEKAQYKWIFPEMDNYFEYYKNHFDGVWKEYFETGIDTGLYTSGSVHFVFKDIILKKHLDILKNINISFTQDLIKNIQIITHMVVKMK